MSKHEATQKTPQLPVRNPVTSQTVRSQNQLGHESHTNNSIVLLLQISTNNTLVHVYAKYRALEQAYALMHTLSLMQTHTHTHSLSCKHTHTHTLSHANTHTHTLSLMQTHTHTHTLSISLSHTHTHTQTHKQANKSQKTLKKCGQFCKAMPCSINTGTRMVSLIQSQFSCSLYKVSLD